MANKQQETPKQTQPTGTTKQGEQTMATTTKKETPKQQTTKTKKETNMKPKQPQPVTTQQPIIWEKLDSHTQHLLKEKINPHACGECGNYHQDTTDYNYCINQCKTLPEHKPHRPTPQPKQITLQVQQMYDLINVTKYKLNTVTTNRQTLEEVTTYPAIATPDGIVYPKTIKYTTPEGTIKTRQITEKILQNTTKTFTTSKGETIHQTFHTLNIEEQDYKTVYTLEESYHNTKYNTPQEYMHVWHIRTKEYTFTPKNGPVTRTKETK